MKIKSTKPRGFALIATILLMVLLAIITVGTLSLSVVTLRSSTQDSAQAKARANARMALMIAVAELQKQMGPDQRISANSSILSDSSVTNGHWLGVWDSWKAGNGEASQHNTIVNVSDEMAPTYLPNRSDYFREWLVCLNDEEKSNISSPSSLTLNASPLPGADDDAILLVADGSLGDDPSKTSDYVAARLLNIKDQETSQITGRFSWWVGDESQKSRIMDDSYLSTPATTAAEKIFRSQAPGSTGTKTITGLQNITDDSQLARLPSLATLDLVSDVVGRPAKENFHHASPFSFSVLADVREGGLKRDLSVLLERPIDIAESTDEFMLYRFDSNGQERVPIQDLAAYYQLYDNDASWTRGRRGGVQYTSGQLGSAIQVQAPDHDGATMDRKRFLREYTSLYKNPVPIKIQFLLAVGAQPITAADRADIAAKVARSPRPTADAPVRDSDTHKLRLGVIPVVTLWNPNNLPLVMDKPQFLKFNTPPFALKSKKFRTNGSVYTSPYFLNLNYAMGGSSVTTGGVHNLMPHVLQLRFARNRPIVFEPGEVKMFSIPATSSISLFGGNTSLDTDTKVYEPVNKWDPFGVFLTTNSEVEGPYGNEAPEVFKFNSSGSSLVFEPGDKITYQIVTESSASAGTRISQGCETYGAGFNFYFLDDNYEYWTKQVDFMRHYQFMSRFGSAGGGAQNAAFNQQLMSAGFPGGVSSIDFESQTNAMLGSQIISATQAGEVIAIMDFTIAAGCEVGTLAAGGFGGGRRTATRPFLHGSTIAPPFVDQMDKASLYDYGWDWQVNRINTVEDSIIQGDPGTGNGFYGGGYTVEAGSTHVVQQEIPVVPPLSIAALSSAHLGGFSLAEAGTVGSEPYTDLIWWKNTRMRNPQGDDFQRVMATGQGGLAPHVLQAVANSYAHPNIPADKAYTTKSRLFDSDQGARNVTFADHSYLVNKALWDDFFFSSIIPKRDQVQIFRKETISTTISAKQTAEAFFFNKEFLPNRRFTPYMNGLDQEKVDTLFTESTQFANGLADKIATHLMVKGGFNINSTSVEAWKTFLSSLKGKPVAYLDGGVTPLEVTSTGTPIGSASLPNGAPYTGSSNNPADVDQWKNWRELTDVEIEELAIAIVKQVKIRGPFLSLSEFINRRLDGNLKNLATKGALQAALDDEEVSINKGFRDPARMLDSEAVAITNAVFPEALNGPIAYGSNAYVDQADLLRNFSEQLTPRGDTFVIRTYGDSLDKNGKVIARAWCEAVVQRLPDYVSSEDEAHLKHYELISESNRKFGRKLEITGFRWLNPSEI